MSNNINENYIHTDNPVFLGKKLNLPSIVPSFSEQHFAKKYIKKERQPSFMAVNEKP